MNKYNILQCPYCKENFRDTLNKNRFDSLKCSCGEYPIIENIVYLKKDDLQTNKKIIVLIKQKKYLLAVWKSLTGVNKKHKYIILFVYFIYYKYSIFLSKNLIIKILELIGPSKSWFTYLLNRSQKEDFKFTLKQFENEHKNISTIIDIGCGIGLFWEKLQRKNKQNILYVGVDKSFLSLLIAFLSLKNTNSIFVCADVEVGIPIITNGAPDIIFLDCFTWIYSKLFLVKETYRILQKKGSSYFVNLRADKQMAEPWWGYGIHPKQLLFLLKNKFYKIDFYNINEKSQKITKFARINRFAYSCIAYKK